MQRLSGILLSTVIILFATSCGNVKNLQYVQGAFDTTRLSKVQFQEPVIQRGDLLSITVLSDDPTATALVVPLINKSTSNLDLESKNASASNETSAITFLVAADGKIRVYKLGEIAVEGLTTKKAADTIAALYSSLNLLKNPYVEVRFQNFKVTLVGEVAKPGTYSIPTDKVNIFEALGMAGDITVYGKRNNVLVVREANGQRQFAQLDLSKPEVFASPYYYLQQNDMVIVDVAKNKGVMNDQMTARNITIAASLLATIAIFINIFK